MEKLSEKITDFVAECETMYGINIVYHDEVSLHTLKRLRKKLYAVKKDEGITSEYGTQLRLNRSIQAEETFAEIKGDMNFRRYLYRGKKNVLAQSVLIAMGRNMNKLHHRIEAGRTGVHLYEVKTA